MIFTPVAKDFFEGSTTELARRLLGCLLVHETDVLLAGRIVEVEAYLGAVDPAAHTHRGPTERTRAMFGPAGYAYIYFSYGNHYCINVAAQPAGVGEGVLIRAIEPVQGVEEMRKNRGGKLDLHALTNGPGKLTQAMRITKKLYGHDLTTPPLFLSFDEIEDGEVEVGPRIGISKAIDLPLRFYVKGSPFVSKRSKRLRGRGKGEVSGF